MINPIRDNRIVNDMTFATRFRLFLDGIQVCDACADEELDYLTKVADKLVAYQRATCPEEEKWYFENLGRPIKESEK